MPIVKKKAGRISPVLMGNYDNTTTYKRLDWIYCGGTSYICKKNNTVGIAPSNTERWQKIIELPTEINMTFNTATTRTNITSGEKLSVILGKIAKFFADLKTVAFTGSYTDLSNRPNSLKNPNTLNIKFNGTSQASYDGSSAKEVNITPAGISAVNTSALLNTTEQISANTNANNFTGALAAKAMMDDYNNKITQINSNLRDKMSTTTILPLKEYNVDTEYTPECNPLDFIYYIPIIDWNRILVTTRCWYSDTQEVIFISYAIIEADLSLKVICFNVVINRTTGAIRIIDAKIWHSTNPARGENIKSVFLGLVGIKS